ncbi:hypothetical protein A5712_20370 [Mycobacterium sp. E2327]|uniref:hypothetical protein n=1 Tax=Mycobacterium sp. E2327 TaxID=1834132 RepID=UPI000802468C|nr:hypothetical protein [Mycobacterium sp. E2327]OBI19146.1 hypothetical protein A5712_20370 [Mycobacterium sp. E2327]
MKAQVKKAIAVFGGTAVLAATIGLGGASPSATASSPTPHPAPSATVAHPGATALAGGSGVHIATLTACVSGLDC